MRVLIEKEYTTARQLTRVSERDVIPNAKNSTTTLPKTPWIWWKAHLGMAERKSIVIRGEAWHKGVIGIVASRMVEQFYKPTIVFSQNDGMLTGSARSVKEF